MGFKIGDKVVRADGNSFPNGEFDTITSINGDFRMAYKLEKTSYYWFDNELKLYVEPKTLTEREKLQEKLSDLKLELFDKEKLVSGLKRNIEYIEGKIKDIEESERVKIYNVRKYNDGRLLSSEVRDMNESELLKFKAYISLIANCHPKIDYNIEEIIE